MTMKIRFALAAACVALAAFPAAAKHSKPAAHVPGLLACGQGTQPIIYGNPAVGVIQVARDANIHIDVTAESPTDNAEYESSVLRVSAPFAPDPGPVRMAPMGNKYVARVSVSGSLAGYTPSRVEGRVDNMSTLAHNVIVRISGSCDYLPRARRR